MPVSLRCVDPQAIIVGYDFSTGSVKALAFGVDGQAHTEVRFPTELFTEGGVSELSYLQLEGQALATTRAIAADLADLQMESHWVAGGISATHHTAGWLDDRGNPIRRMICWNDQTLAKYHTVGLERLGGQERAKELSGGPWAVRYGLSHFVKDEETLSELDWKRLAIFAPHALAAGGYLTGNFHQTSPSTAASSGLLDLRTNRWRREMLAAVANEAHRETIWNCLPEVTEFDVPLGALSESVALDAGLHTDLRPVFFPTLDDQAAGLVGGGATEPGQIAIILGNSAVVNSSSNQLPTSGTLDCMKLNWGPYLWMRCYSNGAQFLDRVLGPKPDWPMLEASARSVPPGCDGVAVLPFVLSEPSIGVDAPRFEWIGNPAEMGVKLRASFEAIAYLMAMGVAEHEAAGQRVTRVTVSGGIAKSDLMCEIIASVLNKPVERLQSNEGPALGAAVVALAGMESYLRKEQGITEPYTVGDAVAQMVKFRGRVDPKPEWVATYRRELDLFTQRLRR